MKNNILLYIVLFGTFFSVNQILYGQQEVKGLKQLIELNIDELGNAEVDLTSKLNAQQWAMFKSSTGTNQSAIKRSIEKAMPAFFLSDFKYEEEPMERTYTIKMKAMSVTQLDKNGRWRGDLDMKNPDISKVSDTEYRLDVNMLSDGGFIEQVQKIKLPDHAKNSKIEKDSFGKAILTYELNSGSTTSTIAKFAGGLLTIAGLGLLFLRLRKKEGQQES